MKLILIFFCFAVFPAEQRYLFDLVFGFSFWWVKGGSPPLAPPKRENKPKNQMKPMKLKKKKGVGLMKWNESKLSFWNWIDSMEEKSAAQWNGINQLTNSLSLFTNNTTQQFLAVAGKAKELFEFGLWWWMRVGVELSLIYWLVMGGSSRTATSQESKRAHPTTLFFLLLFVDSYQFICCGL